MVFKGFLSLNVKVSLVLFEGEMKFSFDVEIIERIVEEGKCCLKEIDKSLKEFDVIMYFLKIECYFDNMCFCENIFEKVFLIRIVDMFVGLCSMFLSISFFYKMFLFLFLIERRIFWFLIFVLFVLFSFRIFKWSLKL